MSLKRVTFKVDMVVPEEAVEHGRADVADVPVYIWDTLDFQEWAKRAYGDNDG